MFRIRRSAVILSPPLHHDYVIAMSSLHLHPLRIPHRARLKLISCFLKRSIQGPSDFPAQAPPLSRFILGKFSRNLVEFSPVP